MNVVDFWTRQSANGPRLFDHVAVIGGGAWGTALAIIAARAGRTVSLWCRREQVADEINETRKNASFLGDTEIPSGVTATSVLADALRSADITLLVTPSGTLRDVSHQMAPHLCADAPVILCAKGIEVGTGKLLTDVVAEELPGHVIGVLSGPTFAQEAAKGFPTAVTVASPILSADNVENSVAARLAVSLGSEAFRPYVSDDVVGVEIGGAVKNVIAIACGMMTGAGFAENTRSALITRGLDEMKALADALGGRRETVTGLSGVGDLTLTCSSMTSRNMSLGVQLGEGKARSDCFDGRPVVVEGERNSISVTDLARLKGIEMPIAEAVRSILHDGAELGETFARLWSRPLEAEPRALDVTLEHPADETAIQRLADTIS
ncbi:MAG: NAD(P)H-dependent glycerol-3-phosphate dehydrogenase [Pseudomonadota bacterium]